MFTGLIEKTGVLTGRESGAKAGRLTIKPDSPWTDLEEGESIAVNGACLFLRIEAGTDETDTGNDLCQLRFETARELGYLRLVDTKLRSFLTVSE